MNKGFWMAKGGGQLTDRDTAYDNPSRVEPKRPHQWFADTEPELFPNKKQAVHPQNSKAGGSLNANPGWENPPPAFPSVPSQFMDRFFGGEIGRRPFNFDEHNDSPAGTGDSIMRKKDLNQQFGNNSCLGFSVGHSMEGPETCLSYGGLRKVKVNQVKDSDNGFHAPKEHNSDISIGQAYGHGNEASFISMGQGYGKEDDSVILMGHTYNKGDANMRSIAPAAEKGNDNSLSFQHAYNKGETTALSFGGFQEEPVSDQLTLPLNGYGLMYDQSSTQTSEIIPHEELDAPSLPLVNVPKVAKPKSQSLPKNKTEPKAPKKEVANSFPSNVRSLMSTGMLEGLPVKYVSLSKEELGGIVKGSGYLCGCQSCNYTKALNAYEFERHAGCKTKHPNNHIFFESGKTIYQIVQELKSTPENELFDVMQTITGSPINQKSFRIWKESFQVASRELHRIYAKEERKLE